MCSVSRLPPQVWRMWVVSAVIAGPNFWYDYDHPLGWQKAKG